MCTKCCPVVGWTGRRVKRNLSASFLYNLSADYFQTGLDSGSKSDAYDHVVKQRTLDYLMTLCSEEAICWKEKVLQETVAFDETEDDTH